MNISIHTVFYFLLLLFFLSCGKDNDNQTGETDLSDEIEASSDTIILEAEDGVYSENLSVVTSVLGYSGEGFLTDFSNEDDSVVVTTDSISSGSYEVYIGYTTSGWGEKACYVTVNYGSATSLVLDDAEVMAEAEFGTVKLKEGVNTVKVSAYWTWFSIDYVKLVPVTEDESGFDIDETLVTENASDEAVNVYNFLLENFQTNILSGTMAAYNTNITEAEWVHDETGKWPALTCFDLIDYTREWSWIDYDELVDNAINYWDNNGLVAIMWHWRDPSNETDAFYASTTSYSEVADFDIRKVQDSTSDEYQYVINDIDTIATYLQELNDANVPVLFRPLHEAAGGWFWWGEKDAEDCVYLWKLLFDRLVNIHGLNNLIWVWTTDVDDDALEWYPGDDYVDIIGMDIYADDYNSQYINFDNVKDIFAGKKMITLSECGKIPEPDQMQEYGDMWSWFMPWNGDATEVDNDWNKVFSNDFIFTRSDMPSLK